MNRKIVGGLVSVMLLAAPAAFAGTAAPAAKVQTHKTAMHKADTAKAVTHTMGVKHKMVHKTAWHRRKGTATGAQEVNALNTLEAAGYRTITGVHPQGVDIAADAMQAGKTEKVLVTPAGKIMPQA